MNKYYSHFLVKYPNKMEIKFDEELFRKIKIQECSFKNTMRFISISSDELDEKGFEKKRNDFISFFKESNYYISLLFDSISENRHKIISESIYMIEREFRNIIEIVFLEKTKKGQKITDIAVYKDIKTRDKKINRCKVVQDLENPLDDLDFIQLKEFVTENMAISSDKTIINKIDLLYEKINLNSENEIIKKIDYIHESIKEIKSDLITKKGSSLRASNLYNHLTESINEEWTKLYKIRNLWAHNNCIITDKEFEEYNKLSNIVVKKIASELTLLTFFKDDEKKCKTIFNSKDNKKNIIIKKQDYCGKEICKFEFIVVKQGTSIILEKNEFNYKDFEDLFDILELEELKVYNKNPILLYNNDIIKQILNDKLDKLNEEALENLFEEISKRNKEYSYNSIEGEDALAMSREIQEKFRIYNEFLNKKV